MRQHTVRWLTFLQRNLNIWMSVRSSSDAAGKTSHFREDMSACVGELRARIPKNTCGAIRNGSGRNPLADNRVSWVVKYKRVENATMR